MRLTIGDLRLFLAPAGGAPAAKPPLAPAAPAGQPPAAGG
jgi:hypothetical protein